jgi:acetyltransferase-like isoleucine patch superfamily enzyme
MAGRTLPWDWFPGTVPDNVVIDEGAYVETTYSFTRYRSHARPGVRIEEGAAVYNGTMFDVGPQGRVEIGRYAILSAPQIYADELVEIGDYGLVGWNVVIMDGHRLDRNPERRRDELRAVPTRAPRRLESVGPTQPVRIGENAWVSFDVSILPGVTIGEGSVVRARSMVVDDVEPYTIVSGSPARPVSRLDGRKVVR